MVIQAIDKQIVPKLQSEPPAVDLRPSSTGGAGSEGTSRPIAAPLERASDDQSNGALERKRDKLEADINAIGAGTVVGDVLQEELNDLNRQLAESDADQAVDAVQYLLENKGQVTTVLHTTEEFEQHESDVLEAASILSDLSPEALNIAFERLEESGDINVLLRELNDRSEIDQGVTDQDQRDFYRSMINRLDRDNLGDLAEAVVTEDSSLFGRETQAFAATVAAYAPPSVQLELVEDLSAGINEGTEIDRTRAGFVTVDREAVAIAELLGSMDDTPDTLAMSLDTLSDDQLSAVLRAAQTLDADDEAPLTDSAFGRIAEAVNQLDANDPAHLAQIERVWAAGTDLLSSGGPSGSHVPFPNGDAVDQAAMEMRDGMTAIFETHGASILAQNVTQAGVIDAGFREQMLAFSEHVIFGDPPGERQQDAIAAVIDLMDYTFGVANGEHEDTRGLFPQIDVSGDNSAAFAAVSGEIFGLVSEGYGNAYEAALDKAEAGALARNFVIDLAFAVIPGPDGASDFVKATIGTIQSTIKGEIKADFDDRDVTLDQQGFDEAFFQLFRERADSTAINEAFRTGFDGPNIPESEGG